MTGWGYVYILANTVYKASGVCLRPKYDGWSIFSTGTWTVFLAQMKEHVDSQGKKKESHINNLSLPNMFLISLPCPHKKIFLWEQLSCKNKPFYDHFLCTNLSYEHLVSNQSLINTHKIHVSSCQLPRCQLTVPQLELAVHQDKA